jgi:hypothetical protein
MQRRKLLKTIAAGGLMSAGVGTVAGKPAGSVGGISAADLDAVHVARASDVVATLRDPTTTQLERLFAEMGDDEGLMTPEECCYYECQSQCDYCDYPPGCTTNCCCDAMYDDC